MNINDELNLVLPIRGSVKLQPDPEKPDDPEAKVAVFIPTMFAYHQPITNTVFEANFSVIALAKDAIWKRGRAYAADNGPQIARLELLKAAKQIASEDDAPDTGPAIINEIKSRTFVMVSGPKGFVMLPVDIALQQGKVEPDEWSEVESNIVFFTLAFAMAARRGGRAGLADGLAAVMRGSITSSKPMEYAASLTASIEEPTSVAEPEPAAS